MYNFGEIKSKVALLAQRSGDADYLSKITDWVNLAHKLVADSYDFWAELQSVYSFSSVSSQETYYLPSDFDKPSKIFDYTNNIELSWITREEYVSSSLSSVSAGDTGIPQDAMLYGISAVSRVNAAAFTVKVNSSSASDNSGITIRFEGWLDSAKTILGYENVVVSTASPTTYVAGTVSFYGLTRITKSADTTGYISIQDNSSNLLATIAPYDRQSRYPVLYLGLIPNSVNSYRIMYKRTVKKMVDDNDYPFIDCGDFLIMYAYGYSLSQEKESERRAQQIWDKANGLLSILMRNSQDKLGVDYQHKTTPQTNQAHRS